jgi:4-amino-4-deoxy-L-arabinose transferase-like glycosyltransferase
MSDFHADHSASQVIIHETAAADLPSLKNAAQTRQRAVRWAPLLAILASVACLLPLMLNVRVPEYDEAIFLDVARNIQRAGLPLRSLGAQGVFFFDHTSLYVYLLALIANPSDIGLLVARLVTTVAALASVWLTFLIGRELSGQPGTAPQDAARAGVAGALGGLCAALLLAVNPFFITYAFFIRMEVFMVAAMLAGLYLLVRAQRQQSDYRLLGAGVALAVAVLFKEFALLFVGCAAIYGMLTITGIRRRVTRAALLVGPTILGLAGWAIVCWRLSPVVFGATMNRWLTSAAGSSTDVRALTTLFDWLRQITLDLVGPVPVAALLLLAVWEIGVRRRRPSPVRMLLWAYCAAAVGISLGLRLKELRHLIGVVPAAALLLGTGVNWDAVQTRGRAMAAVGKWLAAMVLALGVLVCSPAVIWWPGSAASLPGLASTYRARLYDNDRFYHALMATGDYVRTHTAPGEVITVVHEAPTVGYYADRSYEMLYTRRAGDVGRLLQDARLLVWDDGVFSYLSEQQIHAVQDYVASHFTVAQVIRDDYRAITVYQRNAD